MTEVKQSYGHAIWLLSFVFFLLAIYEYRNFLIQKNTLVGQGVAIAKLETFSYRVERKKHNTFRWDAAQIKMNLYKQDTIFVGSGSRAVIELSGRKIEVGENSIIVIDKTKKKLQLGAAEEAEFLEFKLLRGSALVGRPKKNHSGPALSVRLSDKEEIILSQNANLELSSLRSGSRVTMKEGSATLLGSDGSSGVIKAGSEYEVFVQSDVEETVPGLRLVPMQEQDLLAELLEPSDLDMSVSRDPAGVLLGIENSLLWDRPNEDQQQVVDRQKTVEPLQKPTVDKLEKKPKAPEFLNETRFISTYLESINPERLRQPASMAPPWVQVRQVEDRLLRATAWHSGLRWSPGKGIAFESYIDWFLVQNRCDLARDFYVNVLESYPRTENFAQWSRKMNVKILQRQKRANCSR